MGLIVVSCGGDGERSRNVETIAATACTKKGATKTVSKLDYVCGTAPMGKVWFSVVGKLTTKGAKVCKPLGKYEAAKSRVCGTVKKSNVWVKVAPLPVAVAGVGETTTLPPTVSTAAQSTTSTPPNSSESKSQPLDEVAAALAPTPPAKTVEEFVAEFVPRPVEAQATPLVATSLKTERDTATLANGEYLSINVSVLDQNDKPLAAEGNTIVATSSRPDVTLTNAVSTTDAQGVAKFGKLKVDGIAGDLDVVFTADFGATTKVTVTLAAGPAARLGVVNEVGVGVVNKPLPVAPIVGVFDKDGNLRAEDGAVVVATFNGKEIAKASVGDDGYAEFSGLTINTKLAATGANTVTVTYSAQDTKDIADVTQQIDLVAGDVGGLEIVTQPSVSARAGLLMEIQPAVRLLDGDGNPVGESGVEVLVELLCPVEAPCGLFGDRTVKTDENGVARFSDLVVNGVAGSYQLVFFCERGPGATISNPISLGTGLPIGVRVVEGPTVLRHGVPAETAFKLEVTDKWGNFVDDFDGPLEIATQAIESFEVPKDAKFVSGKLELKGVIAGGTAGSGYVWFGSGKVWSSAKRITVTAGVPAKVEVLAKPGTVRAGTRFVTPLAVRLRDSADNVVEVANRPVKLTLSGATTYDETALTTEQGIATFLIDNLTKAGLTTAKYEDLVGDATPEIDSINVVPGDPQTVRLVSSSPLSERSGVALQVQPTVQLVDASGNDVSQDKVVVVASLALGCMGAKLTNGTATTDSNGRATFAGLTLTGKECSYRLRFAPNGGVASSLVDIRLTFGLPASLEVVTQPAGAVNRVALTTQPIVALKDSAGNVSRTKDIVVSAVLDGTTVTAKTGADGRATFAGVTATGKIGLRTVTFGSTGLPNITSDYFLLSAGTATQLVPEASSIAVAQAGDLPYLKVKDADGNDTNLDQSVIVEAASTSGVAWVSGSRVRTALSGIVSFAGAKVSSSSTSATLKFTVSGRSIATTVNVGFTRELRVGDLGPTGGVIIVDLDKDPAIPGYRALPVMDLSTGGRFVEVAPKGWNGDVSDPVLKWSTRVVPASSNSRFSSNLGSRGAAALNSRQYLDYLKTLPPQPVVTKSAIEIVAEKFAFDADDWVLPAAAEVSVMLGIAKYDNSKLGLTFTGGVATYWSSHYDYSSNAAVRGVFSQSTSVDEYESANVKSQSTMLSVRPVRYFG